MKKNFSLSDENVLEIVVIVLALWEQSFKNKRFFFWLTSVSQVGEYGILESENIEIPTYFIFC